MFYYLSNITSKTTEILHKNESEHNVEFTIQYRTYRIDKNNALILNDKIENTSVNIDITKPDSTSDAGSV